MLTTESQRAQRKMTILICQEMLANQKPTPPSGWKIRIDSMDINELTGSVIGAAIEVHRALGPGLLESIYEECLCRELTLRRISFERQRPLQVQFKGLRLDC